MNETKKTNIKENDYSDEYFKRVPKILNEVQDLYGPRVGKVRFNKIIYEGVTRPELDYEEFFNAWPPVKTKVNIALTSDTKTNFAKGLFQLSHEVVHLLSALAFDDDQTTNNLEEGLAVYFSMIYTKREADVEENFNAPTARTGYRYAYNLVVQLLAHDKNAIKKLRGIQPHFSRISAGDFEQAKVILDRTLINALVAPFEEYRTESAADADKSTGEDSAS